ncbi:MAG: 3-deoxy-D-manno-octulosonic acid transferase [Pseudomonadales bacterium]|nr:3-deoxy-D-manno-octulosonic acid transferase [Pseudomonadales bacterium]
MLARLKALIAFALYLLAVTVLLPLLPLRLWWRARKAPAYRQRIAERFGISRIAPRSDGIWVHAVSVGETFAAAPTVRALQQRYPDRAITITTTTPTGSAQVRSLFGDSVSHVYAPYDWPLCVWLFVRRVRPALLVVMETELWPVTILLCRALSIPVLIANARLSAKSARGYRRISWLLQPTLQKTWVAAQHQHDAERFLALGTDAGRLQVTGSVKFDVELAPALRESATSWRNACHASGKELIWIAASTHEGEDEAALQAHAQLLQQHPTALLILVPRHPERFNSVAMLIAAQGLRAVRRSACGKGEDAGVEAGECVQADTQVLLVDTLGELLMFYGVADAAFVGGSLVPVGGHNYLEPASWGLPVVSGPHTHNFAHIAALLRDHYVLREVQSADELGAAVIDVLNDEDYQQRACAAALELLADNRGASQRLLEFICARLDD